MKVEFEPSAKDEHPEADRFMTEGVAERETDEVIVELHGLMKQAREELTDKLEGNIEFCVRELGVHAHGIACGHEKKKDPEVVRVLQKMKRALVDPDLRVLGIVEPESTEKDLIYVDFEDLVRVLSESLGVDEASLVRTFYNVRVRSSGENMKGKQFFRRRKLSVLGTMVDGCYEIRDKSGSHYCVGMSKAKQYNKDSGEMVEIDAPFVREGEVGNSTLRWRR